MNNKYKVSTWIIFGLCVAATVAIYVLSGYIFGQNSVFDTAISENVFLNTVYASIPAILRSVQIFTIAWAISHFLRAILYKWLSKTNRGATIVKLINNFIKYLVVIIAFFLILGAWGVDTRTLIASAGILSLIIGLGAQSLISDIIAGVFIVFEVNFRSAILL